MKLQCSIQSSHTQLERNQVDYLNYRNEHIWPPTRDWLQDRSFSFDFFTNHNIWLFLNNTSYFEIGAWNFWYFNMIISHWFFFFFSTIHFNEKSLSLFLSQILVCAIAFAAHYFFSFWDLHLLSSLSKNIKIKWEEI